MLKTRIESKRELQNIGKVIGIGLTLTNECCMQGTKRNDLIQTYMPNLPDRV